tara:strand:+ start:5863 stop:6879 length:1017 start_codon:yes stop_codon:yes gene_type:complete
MSNQNPLLNKPESVIGAAKSIEGLLDSKEGVSKKPQEEAAPVEPKEPTEAQATEDTQEVKQKPEEQLEDKVQESLDQEEASQENAIEEQETDYHQVKVNGEVIEVELEELKAGYQKDADYRRKTEELAIEKRQVRSEQDRLTQEYSTKIEELNNLNATLNAEVNNELNSKELDKLFEEDPTEAAKIERKLRRRKETISQSQVKLRQHQEQQFQKILAEEQNKVALKHPDFVDPIKGATLKTNMRNYLVQRGFNDKEVSSIYDSRMFDVVMDGMKHLNSANRPRPNIAKKIVKPSKVVRSGVKVTKDDKISQSRLDQFKTLKKSKGDPKIAADLLKRYL